MKSYTINQLTMMTSLEEEDVQQHLSFIARILPEGLRNEANSKVLMEDTALKILKDLVEKSELRI
jgi:hypothetical protein